MTSNIEVKTSLGVWVLRKPKAGPRNRAMIKAETSNGEFKMTILSQELLPKMIIQRPENIDKDVPLKDILDDLEIEDYDALQNAAMKLIYMINSIDEEGDDLKKKS